MSNETSPAHESYKPYLFIAGGCGLFIFLTVIAMVTYAGGSTDNYTATGYSFTHSFLSNLGMLTSLSGKPNWASAILFFFTLATAGVALIVFFIRFQRLFQGTRFQSALSLIGTTLGVLAGVSFVGIAFAPADIARPAHIQFVMWAFRLFPLAVLCYVPVLFMDKLYPQVYAWIFTVFCLMLVGYYVLMTNGPGFETEQGLVIQVVGQKVISYSSVISVGIQSLGAYNFIKNSI